MPSNIQYPTLLLTFNGVTSTVIVDVSTFNIGRGTTNNLVLRSASIPQLAGQIYLSSGTYYIHQYVNGSIKLNGSPLTADTALANGAVISIGNAQMTFNLPIVSSNDNGTYINSNQYSANGKSGVSQTIEWTDKSNKSHSIVITSGIVTSAS